MKRTPSGLRNAGLFHNVDYVVFVEGGRSKTHVSLSDPSNGSLDISFWKSVFEQFSRSKRFRFKAVGSKSELLPIADDVEMHELRSVIVAMDRDFDYHTGNLRQHPQVIYTRGYSWENDVWDLNELKGIVESFSTCSPLSPNLDAKITASIAQFRTFACRLARLDVASVLARCPPILKREEVRRYLHVTKGRPPVGDRNQAIKRIAECKKARKERIQLPEEGPRITERDCCGHFISDFGFHLLRYSLKKQGLPDSISRPFASLSSIREFCAQLHLGKRTTTAIYYSAVINDALL